MRILIIGDCRANAAAVAAHLRDEGFAVDHAGTLVQADDALTVARYDAVISDRVLPDGDGLGWVRAWRRRGSAIPILITAAEHNAVDQRVEGLNAGADDYLPKSVTADELIARLRAILRRSNTSPATVLHVGNIAYDTVSREAWVDGRPLKLPRRETCILALLIRRAGKTVTKRNLEDGLYSFDADVSSNAIEVSVYRLRGHLACAGASARVRTVRGTGYVLEESLEPAPATDLPSIPETVMMAARVATALAGDSESGGTVAPAIAPALTDPGMGIAIVAAALAISMSGLESSGWNGRIGLSFSPKKMTNVFA